MTTGGILLRITATPVYILNKLSYRFDLFVIEACAVSHYQQADACVGCESQKLQRLHFRCGRRTCGTLLRIWKLYLLTFLNSGRASDDDKPNLSWIGGLWGGGKGQRKRWARSFGPNSIRQPDRAHARTNETKRFPGWIDPQNTDLLDVIRRAHTNIRALCPDHSCFRRRWLMQGWESKFLDNI